MAAMDTARLRTTERNPFFSQHCLFLACVCVVDIVLNSSVEFGDLPGQELTTGNNATILVMFVS
jgi:hypothetical protein